MLGACLAGSSCTRQLSVRKLLNGNVGLLVRLPACQVARRRGGGPFHRMSMSCHTSFGVRDVLLKCTIDLFFDVLPAQRL